MKLIGTRCLFNELKPGDMFSNNDEAFYSLANEKEYGLGVFIRSDKDTPSNDMPGGYQVSNAMVYKLKLVKPKGFVQRGRPKKKKD